MRAPPRPVHTEPRALAALRIHSKQAYVAASARGSNRSVRAGGRKRNFYFNDTIKFNIMTTELIETGKSNRTGERNRLPIRLGLTLIEVLIATTITLLMMLALAKGFQSLSNTVSEGRSHLNLSDKLRGMNELLRSDLRGITTDGSTPQSALLPAGYIKYYDGPISDSTATLFNQMPIATEVENRISASRWGDIDDILMFTAKAGQGQVFRGKVPHALLVISHAKKPGNSLPSWNAAQWQTAWNTDVTISSEYAEIVWFMMPLNELNTIDPSNPDNMVIDVIPGVDRTGDGVPDTDGMPDRIALCRRVLLIRPDLDISLPEILVTSFFGTGSTTNRYVWMQPLVPTLGTPNTFRYMMQNPYQRCDLSVRPQLVPLSSGSSFVSVQTNSIETLHLPENRFAHYGFPVTGGTTLPSLALSTEFANPNAISYIAMTNPIFASFATPTLATFRDRGFLPSCFMRTKPVINASGAITAVPLLEEVVSADVVAFDVKGFDASVKQLAHRGSDGEWGVAFSPTGGTPLDDNLDGTANNTAEYNWPGSDDLSLTPSDPGYALQLAQIALTGAPSRAISGSGAFVDAGWGGKVFNSNHQTSTTPVRLNALTAAHIANIANFFPSNLSVLDKAGTNLLPADSLKLAGAHYSDPTVHQVYQPSFDTFTTAYDFDGEQLLRPTSGTGALIGLVWQEGLRRLGFTIAYGAADPVFPLTDTKPPVSGRLPSIQATIRVQDFTAGNLQQISVLQDLNN
jgi:hypothetical protein